MSHVCPVWLGYFLLNPLRTLWEDPDRMLRPFVREGMTVLEPGCAMGYFTLPLAQLVGPRGRVVAVDLQERMLARLRRRAAKAGLLDRIAIRACTETGLGIEDLAGSVDFAVAIHVVHEVPEQASFLAEIWRSLKPGARVLFVEPKGHVSAEDFQESIAAAGRAGFEIAAPEQRLRGLAAVLVKPAGAGNAARPGTRTGS